MSLMDPSFLNGANADYLDTLYRQYLDNPDNVTNEWQQIFADFPKPDPISNAGSASGSANWVESAFYKQAQVIQLIDNYRRLSHLVADVDPLGLMQRAAPDELALESYGLSNKDMDSVFDSGNLAGGGRKTLREILRYVQDVYSGPIGFEYRYISDAEQREWLREQIETVQVRPSRQDEQRIEILQKLTAAEVLETHLHRKYVGQKRFSLEGGDALVPMMYDLIQRSGAGAVEEIVIGMAHRGRLNMLVNILGKSPAKLFKEFEGEFNLEDEENEAGDVKYHQGFSADIQTPGGSVHVALAFNPSHLEIVNPVVEGSVRARQERRKDENRNQVLPILIHGDAAFAGQGVVMETLNMSRTRGYGTGGSIHIIVNNQIGFTTNALDARSTIYCTEVAKMVQAPIIHVNGDDADAVIYATEVALAYRCKFQSDVIIDLVCYRRHGHNEADEPTLTQPIMYWQIKQKPTPRALYATQLESEGVIEPGVANSMMNDYRVQLDSGHITAGQIFVPNKSSIMVDWEPYLGKAWNEQVHTGVKAKRLSALNQFLVDNIPDDYGVHPRIQKIGQDRIAMARGELPMDWGCAEMLAYGTLVEDGYQVRLSGQDCGRGTFSHRHAVVHNQKEAASWVPLREVADKKSGEINRFLVINSLLSEEAVLGFEYGFSTTDPKTLVIWEAQFGDFANGAQVVIDQFISSGYAKWQRVSNLVMLLPHGQEGQGAEHSSARLERYLQLCAGKDMQVCQPTTPAQVFHMLRRQMMRSYRRPLIVMSPKSLLRHKLATSSVDALAEGSFKNVIGETTRMVKKSVRRVVLCSGKVYYDLLEERQNQKIKDVALVRVEQLYPFPRDEVLRQLKSYKHIQDIVWCQEEPKNQGAWDQIKHVLRDVMQGEQQIRYIGRRSASAPAVGYYQLFLKQQRQLVLDALSS